MSPEFGKAADIKTARIIEDFRSRLGEYGPNSDFVRSILDQVSLRMSLFVQAYNIDPKYLVYSAPNYNKVSDFIQFSADGSRIDLSHHKIDSTSVFSKVILKIDPEPSLWLYRILSTGDLFHSREEHIFKADQKIPDEITQRFIDGLK